MFGRFLYARHRRRSLCSIRGRTVCVRHRRANGGTVARAKRTPGLADGQSVHGPSPRAHTRTGPPSAVRAKRQGGRPAPGNSPRPPARKAIPKTGPRARPGSPAARLRVSWSNATRWTKAAFGALAVLATIVAAVPVVVNALHTRKTPVLSPAAADANTLNSLRAGELYSAFQGSLKASPTVNVWGRAVQIQSDDGPALISDYLFVLRTVYVEAFVGSNGTVDAYTITARAPDMPHGISILGHNYDLGSTTLANAPLDGISLVAGVCAIHISAYYEVSRTDEADSDQTVAVGRTAAGKLPQNGTGGTVPSALCSSTNSLALAAGGPGYNPQSGAYQIEEMFPTAAYLASSLGLRQKMPINAVTITAPGYPVAPEMISLHPEEVVPYAPRQ